MPTTQPVPAPRVALFNTNTVYQWTSGQNFNGFLLIILVPPSDGSTPWSGIDYGNLYPSLPLPLTQRIPIIAGQANGSCGVYLNADLTPPNSNYVAYYYDATNRQIAGPTAPFTVLTQAAFTPPILALVSPSTPGVPITPDA